MVVQQTLTLPVVVRIHYSQPVAPVMISILDSQSGVLLSRGCKLERNIAAAMPKIFLIFLKKYVIIFI